MTDERMSPEEALETVEGYILDNDVSLAGVRPDLATLRAYLADAQEIVRLAREVVEDAEDMNSLCTGSYSADKCAESGEWSVVDTPKIAALRDRLEKHA